MNENLNPNFEIRAFDLYRDGCSSRWIQTMPGNGWWTILRLCSAKESFFDKRWRPSEIELVK